MKLSKRIMAMILVVLLLGGNIVTPVLAAEGDDAAQEKTEQVNEAPKQESAPAQKASTPKKTAAPKQDSAPKAEEKAEEPAEKAEAPKQEAKPAAQPETKPAETKTEVKTEVKEEVKAESEAKAPAAENEYADDVNNNASAPEAKEEAPAAPAEDEVDAPAEDEAEAPAEGEADAPAEGEAEAPAEGEGKAPAEGKDKAPATYTVTFKYIVDGAAVAPDVKDDYAAGAKLAEPEESKPYELDDCDIKYYKDEQKTQEIDFDKDVITVSADMTIWVVVSHPEKDEPAADEPAADEPVADEPVADEPVADEPTADEPAADEPVADEAEAAEVTVKFVVFPVKGTDGEGWILEQTYAPGEAVALPKAEDFAGFPGELLLGGWYLDEAMTQSTLDYPAVAAEGAVFYAIAIDPATEYGVTPMNEGGKAEVVFRGNGNTGGNPPATIKTREGDTITMPGPGTMTKTGYTFVGWSYYGWWGSVQGDKKNITNPYLPGTSYRVEPHEGDPGNLVTRTYAFDAIWVKNNDPGKVYFSIRKDNTIPSEPASYKTEDYIAVLQDNNANNYLSSLSFQYSSSGVSLKDKPTDDAALRAAGITSNFDDYEVIWYVVKYDNTKAPGWHVDGIIRPSTKVYLQYDSNAAGSTVGNIPRAQEANKGDTVQVSKDNPTRDGYEFTGWNTSKDGKGRSYNGGESITLNATVTLYAQWKPKDGHLTVTKTVNDLKPYYTLGEKVTYTITATNDGTVDLKDVTIYDVTQNTNSDSSSLAKGNNKTWTVTHTITKADVAVGFFTNTANARGTTKSTNLTVLGADASATVQVKKTYTVKVTAKHGTVGSPDNQAVAAGESATFTVTPDEGYKLPQSVDGATISDNKVTVSGVNGDTNITVTCVPVEIAVKWMDGENQLTDEKFAATTDIEKELTLPKLPNEEGRTFKGWQVGEETVTDSLDGSRVWAAADKTGTQPTVTLTAVWETVTHVITVEVTNGTATAEGLAEGKLSVEHGKDATITFTPQEGYTLQSVQVDNAPAQLTSDGNYTFPDVKEDHTIKVVYALDKGGDGIPDTLQATVTYDVVNGTWDGSDKAQKTENVVFGEKDANGNWVEKDTVELHAPEGMQADTGYKDGSWSTTDGAAPKTVTKGGVMKFTYTFVKDEGQTKTLKYTVEYYQDGTKVKSTDYTAEVWVNDPDTLAVQEAIDTRSDKYTGYKLDHTEPAEVPAKDSLVNNETVIRVYYVKDANGDNVADKYQVTLKFEASPDGYGTVSETADGAGNESYTKVVTLKDSDGKYVESANINVESWAKANEGYKFIKWDKDLFSGEHLSDSYHVEGGKTYIFTAEFGIRMWLYGRLETADGDELYSDDIAARVGDEYVTHVAESGEPSLSEVNDKITAHVLKQYNGYILDHFEGATSGQVGVGTQVIAIYAKDEKDKDGNPSPDGIPDKYQVKVNFQVKNGAWNEGGSETITEYYTLATKDEATGTWTANDNVATNAPAAGDKPGIGYKEGGWITDEAPDTVSKEMDGKTYTYEYAKNEDETVSTSYTVEYYKDGEKVEADSYTRTSTDWAGNTEHKIAIQEEIDKSDDKYSGYRLDSTDPEAIPGVGDEVANGTTITLNYVKDESKTVSTSYTVEYYKDGVKVEADSYTRTNTDWAGNTEHKIAIQEEINKSANKYPGYTLESTDPDAIPVVGQEVADGTTITLKYAKDANGDNIPDKNQEVVIEYAGVQNSAKYTGAQHSTAYSIKVYVTNKKGDLTLFDSYDQNEELPDWLDVQFSKDAIAYGTDVGEYPVGMTAEDIKVTAKGFMSATVGDVTDSVLTIRQKELTIKATKTLDYDGNTYDIWVTNQNGVSTRGHIRGTVTGLVQPDVGASVKFHGGGLTGPKGKHFTDQALGVTVTGKDGRDLTKNYDITVDVTVKFLGKFELSAHDSRYDGKEHRNWKILDSYTGLALQEGEDYTIEYLRDGVPTDDFTSAGTITVVVTPKGVYGTEPQTVTYDILKAKLTITVDNSSKVYGDDDPAFTYTVEGLVNGETEEEVLGDVSVFRTNASVEDVGKYEMVLMSMYKKPQNYTVEYHNGNFEITAKTISEPDPEDPSKGQPAEGFTVTGPEDTVYNGQDQMQKPTVVDDNGKTLAEGKDYELKYSANTKNVGEVTVTVTGKGNYEGSFDVTYHITKRTVTVTTESASKVYDSEPLTAPGKIEGLVSESDATFTVTGNQTVQGSSPNTYELQFFSDQMANNYEVKEGTIGTLTVTEKSIAPDPEDPDAAKDVQIDSPDSPVYDGNAHKWAPTVTDPETGKTLVEGKDYTVSYDTEDFTNVTGEITVTITGMGNYSGSVTRTYEITKRYVKLQSVDHGWKFDDQDHSDKTVNVVAGSMVEGEKFEFTGFPIVHEVADPVDNTFKVLDSTAKSSNYDIETEFGQVWVRPRWIIPNASVEQEDIANVEIEALEDLVYNGRNQEQKPAVKADGVELVEGEDFDFSFTDDTKNVGPVTVTVTGKNNYRGSVTVEYNIIPAPLTVTTGSATKIFDNTALRNGTARIRGLVNGETASIRATGSQTAVGSSRNGYAISWDGSALESNYEIVRVNLGTLTVNPAPVVPGPVAPGPDAPDDGPDGPDDPAGPDEPVEINEDEAPLAGLPGGKDVEVSEEETIDEDAAPLAAGPVEHVCCILHFILMLCAFAVSLWYTHDRKKRQEREYELRDELC